LVFNFGQPGAGPVREWLVLRRLWAEGIRPTRVLVEVMPAALGVGGAVEDGLTPSRLARGDVNDVAPDCDEPWSVRTGWLGARLVPVYGSRFCLMSRLAPAMLPAVKRVDYVWSGLDAHGACELP